MTKKNHALITGGSSGIGFALAEEFAKDGYNLVLVSENEDALAAAAERLGTRHPEADIVTITKDLRREEAADELYSELGAREIQVDALVNDAGIGKHGEFHTVPLEDHLSLIRLNILALTKLTRLFLPEMLRNGGKILNLGLVAGFQPGPYMAVYHATKAFVVSLSEALAEELKDTAVTVTCLCPGPTATHFFERAGMENTRVYQDMDLMPPEKVAEEGYRALLRGERIYIPGVQNKIMTFMRRTMSKEMQAKFQKKYYEETEE